MSSIFERINALTIPSEAKLTLSGQLFTILLNAVMNIAPDRFSDTDKTTVQEAAKNNDYQKIVNELQKHFSEEEWNTLVIPKLESIAKSYEDEVLSVIA